MTMRPPGMRVRKTARGCSHGCNSRHRSDDQGPQSTNVPQGTCRNDSLTGSRMDQRADCRTDITKNSFRPDRGTTCAGGGHHQLAMFTVQASPWTRVRVGQQHRPAASPPLRTAPEGPVPNPMNVCRRTTNTAASCIATRIHVLCSQLLPRQSPRKNLRPPPSPRSQPGPRQQP